MYGTERNHVRARCTHHRHRHVRLIRPERHHQLKNRVNRPTKPTDPLPRPVLPLSPSRGDAGDLAYLETRTPHLRKTVNSDRGEPRRRVGPRVKNGFAICSILAHSCFLRTFSTNSHVDNHRQLPLLALFAVVTLF